MILEISADGGSEVSIVVRTARRERADRKCENPCCSKSAAVSLGELSCHGTRNAIANVGARDSATAMSLRGVVLAAAAVAAAAAAAPGPADYVVPPAALSSAPYAEWAHAHWVWLEPAHNSSFTSDFVQSFIDHNITVCISRIGRPCDACVSACARAR